MSSEYILEMKGISKQFPGVLAVDNVDLRLKKGEVLALVGENGAGKSTLIKILSGAYTADEGEIVINGASHRKYAPVEAIQLGIGVIYQELNYLNDVSIAENIFLGRYPVKGPMKTVDYAKLKTDSKMYQEKVGINHDPFMEASRLSIAEKQLMEIAKAFSRNVKVLVFDEPTSALNHRETQNLFGLIKDFVKAGNAVIYISHKMDEIFSISDRVQVMRDGRNVAILDTSKTNKEEVVKHMVGREIKDMYPINSRPIGDTVIEIKGLYNDKVKDISFSVRQGEIFGLFGLMGAGRSEIVKTIYGATSKLAGEILISGKRVEINNPEDALKNGIAYIPSERKSEGLVLDHTVKDNITISALHKFKTGWGSLNLNKEKKIVTEWIDKLRIKTPSMYKETSELSGGNQQKIVLSKCLLVDPKIIIMNEPTKGIDVGAKVEIYKLMEELCQKGFCIIVISSELPEIMAVSDRIAVISNGRLTGICDKKEYTQELLMNYAIGGVVQ